MTRTDTTITVSWTPPATRGRDDFSYEVHHSDPENLGGDFIRAPGGNLVDRSAEMFLDPVAMWLLCALNQQVCTNSVGVH